LGIRISYGEQSHTYGVDLNVDKFNDINLLPISNPISEAKIVIKKSDIKADLPEDIQITLEPSKHQTPIEKRRCLGKYESDILELFTRKSTPSLYCDFFVNFCYFRYSELLIQFNYLSPMIQQFHLSFLMTKIQCYVVLHVKFHLLFHNSLNCLLDTLYT
jgi:hypothetical protein